MLHDATNGPRKDVCSSRHTYAISLSFERIIDFKGATNYSCLRYINTAGNVILMSFNISSLQKQQCLAMFGTDMETRLQLASMPLYPLFALLQGRSTVHMSPWEVWMGCCNESGRT